jgi:hypothetical protein
MTGGIAERAAPIHRGGIHSATGFLAWDDLHQSAVTTQALVPHTLFQSFSRLAKE